MLVRHPQPADLDKGGKFWTRVQLSPTPECTRINLLNQVPQTHALGGIQTWLATGPHRSDALPQVAQSVCADRFPGGRSRRTTRLPRTRLCCMPRPTSIE